MKISTRKKLSRLAIARWRRIHAERARAAKIPAPLLVVTRTAPEAKVPSPLATVTRLYRDVQGLDQTAYDFFFSLLGSHRRAAAVVRSRQPVPSRHKLTGLKLKNAQERARAASKIRWDRHRAAKAAKAATG